jgi:hypothetical protein
MRFNRWTVIQESYISKSGHMSHLCRCDCGTVKAVDQGNLKSGLSKSCGCLKREVNAKRMATQNLSHNRSGTPEFAVWVGIRSRCNPANAESQPDYAGRGITVCERWSRFENFIEDMGDRPTVGHSIDRIDVNGNYEPGNCRWATAKEQANNRRDNRIVLVDGERLTIAQAMEKTGLTRTEVSNQFQEMS